MLVPAAVKAFILRRQAVEAAVARQAAVDACVEDSPLVRLVAQYVADAERSAASAHAALRSALAANAGAPKEVVDLRAALTAGPATATGLGALREAAIAADDAVSAAHRRAAAEEAAASVAEAVAEGTADAAEAAELALRRAAADAEDDVWRLVAGVLGLPEAAPPF